MNESEGEPAETRSARPTSKPRRERVLARAPWATLRAAPLAVLLAIVVAAVAARLRRPREGGRATAPEVTAKAVPDVPPLARPLAGPSPPPSARVDELPPRMIHGGVRHTHRAAARGPREPKVGFHVDVGGPVAAQIVASKDGATLYVATLGGSVVALARRDGAKLWSVDLGDRVYSTPYVSDDGTLYVGTDAKKLFALTPDGKIAWRLEVEGEADTGVVPTADGAVVFAAGSEVYAVRPGGAVAWRFSAKRKIFTTPAVTADGLVVVGSQDDHVYALGPGGAVAWKVDLGADVDGAPAVGDDGAIFVGTDAGEVVRLDEGGGFVWRAKVGGFVRGALSVARNGDVLAGTYGPVPRMVRVAPDGAIRGAFAIAGTGAREFGIHGGALEDAAGVLYFGTQDDAVYAVEPDGSVRFRFETGGDVDAPLSLLPDGSLIFGCEDGSVTLLLP